MNLRVVVLACAALGLPAALLALVLPITWGYGGYNFALGTPYEHVYFSDPAGPAYAAGVRVGQNVVPNKGAAFIQEDAGPIGTVVHEHVVGADGRTRVISFAFVPFAGELRVQQQIDKSVAALTALCAYIVAILVLLRARDRRVGLRAAAVLFFSGSAALSFAVALVCANAWCAELFYYLLPPMLLSVSYWSALSMLAIYPPTRTTLRRILWWFGGARFILTLVGIFGRVTFIATGVAIPIYQFAITGGGGVLTLIFAIVMIAAIIDAIANARGEDAAPVRWLGGAWLIATGFSAVPAVDSLAGGPKLATHYGDFVNAAYVLFIAFGVAYPVLRHRLVDLNILVSRATVFTVVSTIIVGLFIAAEWAIGKVFEESFALSHGNSGIAAQFLTLLLVLALGMSARSIHGFVEERLTKAFFRKRMQGLAEIERLAGEADVATDADALMQLGVQTVRRALNPLGVAYYVRRGDRYERYADMDAGDQAFPPVYAFNEAVPLRLRRWQKAFELDDDSEERLHMLFVPMRVRGDLVGFLCCGPKPDRTTYLEDEVNALSLLAHHTAIASALLPRPSVAADGTLRFAQT